MYRTAIIEALRTRFAGVSDSVLGRIADKLAKTITKQEDVATAVEGVTIQQVIDSYADSRATEASLSAVKNYETKHGLKDGEKVKTTDGSGSDDDNKDGKDTDKSKKDKQGSGDDQPVWAKGLADLVTSLKNEIGALKAEKVTSERRKQLNDITASLPESLRKAYERTPVDGLSDEDFGTLVQEITTEVQSVSRDFSAKGAVFGKPSAKYGGKSAAGRDELTKEQKEAIAKREGAPASSDAQPF